MRKGALTLLLSLSFFYLYLDYKQSKPVRTYIGSITDEKVLKKACQGVRSVIHIAGIPDSAMFPDKDKINKVNIQGR